VWAIDADGIIVRPGPRVVDGVEAIASVLHPEVVPKPPVGAIARVR
jgi:iron complex transport system substrate-binding protein